MAQYITPNKQMLIERSLQMRSRYVTMVLEDLQDPHNTNAVLRTAEAMGLQDFHIVENKYKYGLSQGVSKGAYKWVDYYMYSDKAFNTPECYAQLKERGYSIVATALDDDAISPAEVNLNKPIAIVLGNESSGLSDYAIQSADVTVKIPTYGFTRSYNVSVTAAMLLNEWLKNIHKSQLAWQLTKEEKDDLRMKWYRKIMMKEPWPKDELQKREGL